MPDSPFRVAPDPFRNGPRLSGPSQEGRGATNSIRRFGDRLPEFRTCRSRALSLSGPFASMIRAGATARNCPRIAHRSRNRNRRGANAPPVAPMTAAPEWRTRATLMSRRSTRRSGGGGTPVARRRLPAAIESDAEFWRPAIRIRSPSTRSAPGMNGFSPNSCARKIRVSPIEQTSSKNRHMPNENISSCNHLNLKYFLNDRFAEFLGGASTGRVACYLGRTNRMFATRTVDTSKNRCYKVSNGEVGPAVSDIGNLYLPRILNVHGAVSVSNLDFLKN